MKIIEQCYPDELYRIIENQIEFKLYASSKTIFRFNEFGSLETFTQSHNQGNWQLYNYDKSPYFLDDDDFKLEMQNIAKRSSE